jgi:NTE family protein
MTIRTLVLSGGGGRGAFHAGVYKYLMQPNKSGVHENHQGPWVPHIVAGTSIGAVNGAAIVQGIAAHELEKFWLSLREHDIQGIPPNMKWLARRVVNRTLTRAIGTTLPRVPDTQALSPVLDRCWMPLPFIPAWVNRRFIGFWNNLLDTGPLYQTLTTRLGLNEEKIAASEKILLITATNVRSGESVTFSNRSEYSKMSSGVSRPGSDITIKRIVASCSIPILYPWTQDDDGEIYWDGAVVANTPLGAAFDVVRDRPMTEAMEVVIVMMTPWWELGEKPMRQQDLPHDFTEMVTWALDWSLLASFRVSLKVLRAFNQVASAEISQGRPQSYRLVTPLIAAPESFLPATRIIDYDETDSQALIDLGYAAAARAFAEAFGAKKKAGPPASTPATENSAPV